MNGSETMKTNLKVKMLKKSYEIIKTKRENISSELSLLDEKIATYDKELKELEKELNRKQERKENQEKNIKPSIKRTIYIFGTCFLLNTIVAIFFKDIKPNAEINALTLAIPAIGASVGINLLPNLLLNSYYLNDYNKTKKKYDNVKKEQEEIISKRISLESQYKDIRESEVMAKKICEETQKSLSSELTHMNSKSDEYRPIITRDIYHKIKVDETYYQETSETKKQIIDSLLKEYLKEKLIESNFTKINLFIENLSTEELFSILLERVPQSNHYEVLNHIIHAILGVASNMQNFGIVWFEEDNKNLISNPEINFDETGKWTELKTHKDTPYEIIFKTVYNTFMNDFIRIDEYKRKRAKNNKK
ncbi:MAG: hypothetical protein IJE89_04280 [Bacilli bacterium]|nr:hypothetical protein [Bacilli bacterium]